VQWRRHCRRVIKPVCWPLSKKAMCRGLGPTSLMLCASFQRTEEGPCCRSGNTLYPPNLSTTFPVFTHGTGDFPRSVTASPHCIRQYIHQSNLEMSTTGLVSERESPRESLRDSSPSSAFSPSVAPLSPPPPFNLELYEKRPLPPIPPYSARRSLMSASASTSTSSKEMTKLINTPQHNQDHDGKRETVDFKREEAEIAVILDSKIRPCLSPSPPSYSPPDDMRLAGRKAKQRVETAARVVPSTPPDELLSPQPKASVQKILKLTSLRPIGNNSSSPSGHDSPRKVKQLTGMDIGFDDSYRKVLAEDQMSTMSTISPLSTRSSVYSQDTEFAVSEPDSLDFGGGYENSGYASDPNSSYFAQRHRSKATFVGTQPPVPSPLSLPRTEKDEGLRAKLMARHQTNRGPQGHDRSRSESSKYGHDLYHATIAQSAPGTPPYRRARDLLKSGRARASPPKSSTPRWMTLNQNPSPTSSPSGSFLSQIPATPSPRSASAASPASSNDPFISSPFGSSSSSDATRPWHFHHRAAPKPPTGSSSLQSQHHFDPNTPSPPASPPRRHNRRSIISKVFSPGLKRASGFVGGHAPTSAPSAPHSAIEPSTSGAKPSWTHRCTRSASAAVGISPPFLLPHPLSRSRPSTSASASASASGSSLARAIDEASWLRGPRNPTPKGETKESKLFTLPVAMASMGCLAHRTGEVVAQRTGEVVEQARTAAGLRSRAERRRESLKNRIVVVGEDGVILGGTGSGAVREGEEDQHGEDGVGEVTGKMQWDGPWV